MPYKNWATTDALGAADLNAMTADAVEHDLTATATETTTSTTYANLTTVGPNVTLTLVAGQGCLVIMNVQMGHSIGGAGHASYTSFAVSGAETQAASDSDAAGSLVTQYGGTTSSIVAWYVAGVTGSHTFTMKYKVTDGTGYFRDRKLIVKKF